LEYLAANLLFKLATHHQLMPTLAEAIKVVSAAVQADSPEFAARQYVEVRRNEHEVTLGGNRDGLVWLALHCSTWITNG